MIDWKSDESVVKSVHPEIGIQEAMTRNAIQKSWANIRRDDPAVSALDDAHRRVLERWPKAVCCEVAMQNGGSLTGEKRYIITTQHPRDLSGLMDTEAAAWIDAASKLTLPSTDPKSRDDETPRRVTEAMRRVGNRLKAISAKDGYFDERDLQFFKNEFLDVWDHHSIEPVPALPSLKEEPAVAVEEFTREECEKACRQLESRIYHFLGQPCRKEMIDLQCELNRQRVLLGEGKVIDSVAYRAEGQYESGAWYEIATREQQHAAEVWLYANRGPTRIVRLTTYAEVIELRSAPEGEI